MKTIVKRLVRGEKGQTMIMALVLLAVGGLIIAPLLAYMSTGLISGEVYNRRTAELYAADAGVVDAVWKIRHQVDEVVELSCGSSNHTWTYDISDVNGKRVEISIEYVDEDNYRITSIAATDDGGGTAAIDSATAVESYVSVAYMDFSALLDNAIVSQDTITISPNSEVNGDIWLPDEENLENKGAHNGTVKDSDDMTITWPTVDQLSSYYMELVEGAPDPGPSIDIKDTQTIETCYREGSLAVDNTGEPATLVLEGTVYVTGDLDFRQPGGNDYTVDLNGHTIFVEGNIDFASNAISISGSGCIIAIGYINFQPSIAGGEDDFVLVMSITDRVDFKPSGDFTGCVAGNVHVQLQPNCTINWISPEGKGLDFPMGATGSDEYPPIVEISIASWEISQL